MDINYLKTVKPLDCKTKNTPQKIIFKHQKIKKEKILKKEIDPLKKFTLVGRLGYGFSAAVSVCAAAMVGVTLGLIGFSAVALGLTLCLAAFLGVVVALFPEKAFECIKTFTSGVCGAFLGAYALPMCPWIGIAIGFIGGAIAANNDIQKLTKVHLGIPCLWLQIGGFLLLFVFCLIIIF